MVGKHSGRVIETLRPGDIAGMGEPSRPPALPSSGLPLVEAPEEMFPRAGDPYRAHSRPSNKPEGMICFLMRGRPDFMIFSYANLDTIMPAITGPEGDPAIVLRFSGTVIRDVRLEGRHLMPVVAYLQQHRLVWLRELPTEHDYYDQKDPAITRIVVTEVGR